MFWKILLSVLLTASISFAQRSGRTGGDISGVPMTTAPARINVIAETLKLDKEQKKDVKAILDAAQKEAAPLREQLVKSHQAIGEAVLGGKSSDDIGGLISSHAALEAQMAQIELKAFAKVYQRLNETQQGNSRFLFQMMKGLFSEKNWNEIQQP